MERLCAALEAISRSLEESRSLDATVRDIEQSLCEHLGASEASIVLGEMLAGDASTRAYVPLRIDGTSLGTLVVAWSQPPPSDAVALVRRLAAVVAASIACRTDRADRALLRESARTDALTGIPNRLAFDERFATAWRRCRERGEPCTLVLVDVDFFKSYNDEYGHVAGDRCLRDVARTIGDRRLAGGAFAARYGGEEFAVILEGVDLAVATAHAQRIVDRIAERGIAHAGTTLGRVSVSAGVASIVPGADDVAIDLVGEADRALYRAKRLGRNRICAGASVSAGEIVARRSGATDPRIPSDGALFGRDADLSRALVALRHSRLVTLVGPSGIGKSRLLRLVARSAVGSFDGVVLSVELGWLDPGADLATAIAAELNFAVDPAGALETLTDLLDDRETLMLLDNDAQPVERVRGLCDHLLRQTTRLCIVVAVRTPFGIADERSIVVPPLDENAAVELLRARLGNDAPEMVMDSAFLTRIARQLGGNPAAIEAASRQLAGIGPVAFAQRLESSAALN